MFIFHHGKPGSPPHALDVTVTSYLQIIVVSSAALSPGAALVQAEERKYARHGNSCSEQGIMFIPLAVESLGGWSSVAISTLRRIAILTDARRGTSRDVVVATPRLMQQLSICLMRGNANMIAARAQ